jgi:hypothetical protein
LHVAEIPPVAEVKVRIRTNSAQLIEAGDVLKTLTVEDTPDGLPAELWQQIHRFKIVWVKLPDDSVEIATLQRWATATFVPGCAATHDGLTRQEYREVTHSYESLGPVGKEAAKTNEEAEDAA